MSEAPQTTERCRECRGTGEVTYITNPDNGFLDTRAHMLREETMRCPTCEGKGYLPTPSPQQEE